MFVGTGVLCGEPADDDRGVLDCAVSFGVCGVEGLEEGEEGGEVGCVMNIHFEFRIPGRPLKRLPPPLTLNVASRFPLTIRLSSRSLASLSSHARLLSNQTDRVHRW